MSIQDHSDLPATSTDRDTPTEVNDAERRAVLAKLGALAAWTAPATLTLLTSARADGFGSPPRL